MIELILNYKIIPFFFNSSCKCFSPTFRPFSKGNLGLMHFVYYLFVYFNSFKNKFKKWLWLLDALLGLFYCVVFLTIHNGYKVQYFQNLQSLQTGTSGRTSWLKSEKARNCQIFWVNQDIFKNWFDRIRSLQWFYQNLTRFIPIKWFH